MVAVNAEVLARAASLMPGGVSSPVRSFRGVGAQAHVIRSAAGAILRDVDGREWVDLQMAFGPLIVGHAHPAVVSAISATAAEGAAFGATSLPEIELAEAIVTRHPGMAWTRFVNSGTEAVMSAARVARAATGRDLLVKFDGCYHGHADPFLSKAGSGLSTFGIASSAGVPAGTIADTATLALDDEDALEIFFRDHGDRVAAAIIEGVPANEGLLPQRREWHAKLRALTRAHGALLVVDEVITGFRSSWGGATQRLGLEPDLVTLGKIIGGGLPVGAFGGRRDLMQLVAPLGPVYQAGTLSGSPIAMSAGLATLHAFDTEKSPHASLARRTSELASDLQRVAERLSVPCTVRCQDSMLWIALQDGLGPQGNVQLTKASIGRFAAIHAALLREGVYLPPSPREVCFLSTAHDDAVLQRVVAAFERACGSVRV